MIGYGILFLIVFPLTACSIDRPPDEYDWDLNKSMYIASGDLYLKFTDAYDLETSMIYDGGYVRIGCHLRDGDKCRASIPFKLINPDKLTIDMAKCEPIQGTTFAGAELFLKIDENMTLGEYRCEYDGDLSEPLVIPYRLCSDRSTQCLDSPRCLDPNSYCIVRQHPEEGNNGMCQRPYRSMCSVHDLHGRQQHHKWRVCTSDPSIEFTSECDAVHKNSKKEVYGMKTNPIGDSCSDQSRLFKLIYRKQTYQLNEPIQIIPNQTEVRFHFTKHEKVCSDAGAECFCEIYVRANRSTMIGRHALEPIVGERYWSIRLSDEYFKNGSIVLKMQCVLIVEKKSCDQQGDKKCEHKYVTRNPLVIMTGEIKVESKYIGPIYSDNKQPEELPGGKHYAGECTLKPPASDDFRVVYEWKTEGELLKATVNGHYCEITIKYRTCSPFREFEHRIRSRTGFQEECKKKDKAETGEGGMENQDGTGGANGHVTGGGRWIPWMCVILSLNRRQSLNIASFVLLLNFPRVESNMIISPGDVQFFDSFGLETTMAYDGGYAEIRCNLKDDASSGTICDDRLELIDPKGVAVSHANCSKREGSSHDFVLRLPLTENTTLGRYACRYKQVSNASLDLKYRLCSDRSHECQQDMTCPGNNFCVISSIPEENGACTVPRRSCTMHDKREKTRRLCGHRSNEAVAHTLCHITGSEEATYGDAWCEIDWNGRCPADLPKIRYDSQYQNLDAPIKITSSNRMIQIVNLREDSCADPETCVCEVRSRRRHQEGTTGEEGVKLETYHPQKSETDPVADVFEFQLDAQHFLYGSKLLKLNCTIRNQTYDVYPDGWVPTMYFSNVLVIMVGEVEETINASDPASLLRCHLKHEPSDDFRVSYAWISVDPLRSTDPMSPDSFILPSERYKCEAIITYKTCSPHRLYRERFYSSSSHEYKKCSEGAAIKTPRGPADRGTMKRGSKISVMASVMTIAIEMIS